MRNKDNKKCCGCKEEVVEKKVKTQKEGKDYYEEVEKKEETTPDTEAEQSDDEE